MTPWQALGIEPTPDERAIKRAYAKQLKQTRPDEDKEGFLRLREAYERALEIRHWVLENEEDGGDETSESVSQPVSQTETVVASVTIAEQPDVTVSNASNIQPDQDGSPSLPPPVSGPTPPPIRLHWNINPTPAHPAPPLPVPEPVRPARNRTDYLRGWRHASRLSEDALTRQIEADLADPALVHLEVRAEYERDLLAWMLKHKSVWPETFRMAMQTLHWQEKQQLWPEWPWSQLDAYHRRCRIHAFFADPARFRDDSPALSGWLVRTNGAKEPKHRLSLPGLLLKRSDLARELKEFRSTFGDILHHEPEGVARLQALEAELNRFPLDKLAVVLAGLLLGGGLVMLSADGGSGGLTLFLISLAVLGLSVFTLYGLLRDFVLPALHKMLQQLLQPPSWLVISSLMTVGLAIGIPNALLLWKMPHLADGLHVWLNISGAILTLAATQLWNRGSDWLAMPPKWLQDCLSASVKIRIPLLIVGITLPMAVLEAVQKDPSPPPGWLLPGVSVTTALCLLAMRIHRRFGPGIPRRFLAYLAFVILDTALLLTNALQVRKNDDVSGTLMLFFLMLAPLWFRTANDSATDGSRGVASLLLLGAFILHVLLYGAFCWSAFKDGNLIGLAGLLALVNITFYILAHDPKQN